MSNFDTSDYTLQELENMFDRYYRYSDDHSIFMKHSSIEKAIRHRKEIIEDQNAKGNENV